MSDATDRTDAITIVKSWVQIEVVPVLTDSDIATEVDRARLVTTWAANTAYNVGDCVVPAVRNGHCYECIQPGTSQAGARSFHDWPTRNGSRFADGGSDPLLIWEEAGADLFNPGVEGAERNIYDLNRAAKRCCEIKAVRGAPLIDNDGASAAQIRKHWLEEAARYRPFRRPISLIRC